MRIQEPAKEVQKERKAKMRCLSNIHYRLAFLTMIVFVSGCQPRPSTILAKPTEITITRLGATAQVAAEVLDKKGQLLREEVLVWTSSDPTIAEVNDKGMITAKAKGITTIEVLSDNVTTQILVNVKPIGSVRVVPDSVTLFRRGAPQQFAAKVLDHEGKPVDDVTVIWSSTNPKVAVMSESGMVSAVDSGKAEAIARVLDRAASANVSVQFISLPDRLRKVVTNCIECAKGSICKVVVRDDSYFYLLNIQEGVLELVEPIENKGQKVGEINDEIRRNYMEVCRGVYVYGGKFKTGMAIWSFEE